LGEIEERLQKTINITDIPTLPEAARLAVSSTISFEKSAQQISKIISEDPSLTFKILRVANSSIYRRSGKVSNIKDAVVLLGYKTIKGLILSITIKEIFPKKEKEWFNYHGFWIHSIVTALAGAHQARILKSEPEDEAYASGLLHDLGKVILFLSDQQKYREVINLINEKKIPFYQAEQEIFGFDHTDVARFTFNHWKLPQKLIMTIDEHHLKPGVSKQITPSSLILYLANQIAHTAGFFSLRDEPPYEVDFKAVESLGLLSDDLDLILKNIKIDIGPVLEALNIEQRDIKSYFEVLSSANRELGRMHLENIQLLRELETQKKLLANLNHIMLNFLKKKDLEEVLSSAVRSLASHFGLSWSQLDFHLNNKSSLSCSVSSPVLFEKDGENVLDEELECASRIIKRENEWKKDSQIYIIHTPDGMEVGKLAIPSGVLDDENEIKPFIDLLSLGFNNLHLYLKDRLKTERLDIALKKLSFEMEKRRQAYRINELILDNSPAGIISINNEGKILSFNKTSENILQENLKGKNLLHLKIFEKTGLRADISELLFIKGEKDISLIQNGKQLHLHLKIAEIEGSNILLVLINDITRRVENEQMLRQKEKMATLGELASGIAHNLRSPLAVIKGIPELILSEIERKEIRVLKKTDRGESEDTETRENLKLIVKSIQKAFNIIDSLLNFAKLDKGSFEKLDLYQILKEVQTLLEPRVREKNISLQNKLHGCTIIGNKNMLTQVFLNLINNAIDAVSENGLIEANYARKNNRIIIRVEDNGKGIEPEDIERVFEPFYTTSGKANGAGIGLSITKKIIILHGGTIKALFREGGGTVMEITFSQKG